MTKPIIVGEAPSLKGDGRPFTGPSGDRLCRLAGVETYDQLTELFELRNIFDSTKSYWDTFDHRLARKTADRMMTELCVGRPPRDLVLAGKKVMRAFGTLRLSWYTYEQRSVCRLWAFPHPSGLSHYWNEPRNVEAASAFLRARAHRDSTDRPSEHVSLDLHDPQASP